MIHLSQYEKLQITKENILSLISEINIAINYCGDFVFNKAFRSPIRNDDNIPSFVLYNNDGHVSFRDFKTGDSGDVFELIKVKYQINYFGALMKVIYDFRLEDKFIVNKDIKVTRQKFKPKLGISKSIHNQKVSLDIKSREWRDYDIQYWKQYNITLEILNRYDVIPVEYIFINDKIIKADKYAYAYKELKDGIIRYKVYQPFNKKLKWLSNFLNGTISGWRQMNDNDHLIISSSLKDTMTLVSFGYNAINPQTETYNFKPNVISILKEKYSAIYSYYDYDRTGIIQSYKLKRKYGVIPLFTKSTKLKDPSDYAKKYMGLPNNEI